VRYDNCFPRILRRKIRIIMKKLHKTCYSTFFLVGLSFAIMVSIWAENIVDFSGSWWYKDGSVNDKNRSTFYLKLRQEGDKLYGWYDAIALDGNRVDYNSDSTENIEGEIMDNIAHISFKSHGYSGTGKAEITYDNGKIRWKTTEITKGVSWTPKDVVLEKE